MDLSLAPDEAPHGKFAVANVQLRQTGLSNTYTSAKQVEDIGLFVVMLSEIREQLLLSSAISHLTDGTELFHSVSSHVLIAINKF